MHPPHFTQPDFIADLKANIWNTKLGLVICSKLWHFGESSYSWIKCWLFNMGQATFIECQKYSGQADLLHLGWPTFETLTLELIIIRSKLWHFGEISYLIMNLDILIIWCACRSGIGMLLIHKEYKPKGFFLWDGFT